MGIVNSKEYWDQRFEEGDWDAKGGREQSLFFSKVAHCAMPDFLVRDLSKNSWSVVDVGCAEGEGTAYLARQFPLCHFTGVDFSEKAIQKAAQRHSNCDFAVSDIYKEVVAADVVFSSNTLEHLRDPRTLMERMCAAAGKYTVLLLPLEDSLDIEEHINIFSLDTLPLHINEFYLEGYTIVDCAPIKDTMWPGKQVLLVYTSPTYRPEQITLQDIHDHFIGDKDHRIAQLSAQNEEQKTQISQFIQQTSLLETQVQKMGEQAEIRTQELEARVQAAETCAREREAAAARVEREKAQSEQRAMAAEARIHSALTQLRNMTNSRLFKLLHFINRFFRQGFHRDKAERKAFRRWFRGRFRHMPDFNHSYNPLFGPINILEGGTASKAAAAEGPAIAARNTWLERAKQAQALLSPADIGQKYTRQDIIILSVIDYDFRHQRPQHFALRLAAMGHRVYYVNANFGTDYSQRRLAENLWQVTLPGADRVAIHLTDCVDDLARISDPLEALLYQNGIRDAALVVDYPNWIHAALYLRQKYGFKLLTDYMDDFTGFLNPAEALVKRNCERLLRESDGIIASSQFLYEIAVKYNPHVTIDRNGTEYAYFHKIAGKCAENKRPVIGYYGAIAEWFNVDVVCRCARRFPQCDIVLVGNITAHRKQLEKYPNIQLVGEVPYSQLLPYLERFDVCLIPFDTSSDLIKATNPVKFYEYLSAGKKIVATEIPELEPYRGRYVYMENDPDKFCDAVELCLKGADTLADAENRFRFAKENDWDVRAEVFERALDALYPKISIVVLCYNQLDYTKQCVESILTVTAYPNYELILVDNCSTDGTAGYLRELERQYPQVKIVLNQTNRGFAGGNNDGIAISDGAYIVLLNNDAVVTRGWLTGMLKHFTADDRVGLVGPVTNSIGNEARIAVRYQNMADMPRFAYEYTFSHMGEEYPHRGILAMFCLMISRTLYDRVGPLDESYGIGMFEDDDYSVASQRAGFRNVMAEDVFVHHFGSVSFKKLEDKTYTALFQKNRKLFEKKWGIQWSQPQYRPGVN